MPYGIVLIRVRVRYEMWPGERAVVVILPGQEEAVQRRLGGTHLTRGAGWYRGQWCRKSSNDGAGVIGGRAAWAGAAWAFVPERWR